MKVEIALHPVAPFGFLSVNKSLPYYSYYRIRKYERYAIKPGEPSYYTSKAGTYLVIREHVPRKVPVGLHVRAIGEQRVRGALEVVQRVVTLSARAH